MMGNEGTSTTPVFDSVGLLERVDGDVSLFQELLTLFFADYDSAIQAIGDAISAQDSGALESSAHSVKSAVGNLGASQAFELAYKLELMGRNANLTEASARLEQFQTAVAEFKEEAEKFIRSNG
ncbi:MAG: Hpt domain-containing protein [Bdellovibrionales bacterium]|nr:Hpt domain-containing protein [Bdellovibrionales bacterium]